MKYSSALFLSISIVLGMVASSFTLFRAGNDVPLTTSADIVNLDTVRIALSNCALEGKVCLPIRLGDAIKMRITVNGKPLSVDAMNGCDFDSLSAYTYSNLFGAGSAGPYILSSWRVNNQIFTDTFNNIPHLVNLMNAWDPMGNWVHNPATQLISGGNPANRYDTMRVWVTILQSPSYIGYNLGVVPKGTELSFKRGFHTVVLEDTTNNMTDTFYVHAYCSNTVNQTISVGQSQTDCLATTDLLTAPLSIGYCSQDPSNNSVTFSLDQAQNCVTFSGVTPGTASGCVVLCDSTGFCDTTYYNIGVRRLNTVNQISYTISANESIKYCFDSTNTSGQITSITSCNFSNNGFALYQIVGNCVQIKGIKNGGSDFGCIVVCNSQGNCDTTYFSTLVTRTTPMVLYDTLYVNQTDTLCVDQSLVSPVQNFEVFLEPNAIMVDHNLNPTTLCFAYTGLTIGTDTIGVRISNNNGKADTTYLILTVLPPTPQLIIDTVSVGTTKTYCMSTAQLAGAPFTVTNSCPGAQNGQVVFTANAQTLCLDYRGVTLGTDTACMVVCDNRGGCDTFVFIITAVGTITNLLPPVAVNDASLTDQDKSVKIEILKNDNIPGSLTGSILIIPSSPAHGATKGQVAVDPVTNSVVYTPNSNMCDSLDYFQYVICNAAGCDTALVSVMVFCVSKELVFTQGFSPNDDDINDTFVIRNVDQYPGNELTVFNRWGAQVFYAKNYRNSWRGDWNERPLPDGVYYYIFDDGKGKKHADCVIIQR